MTQQRPLLQTSVSIYRQCSYYTQRNKLCMGKGLRPPALSDTKSSRSKHPPPASGGRDRPWSGMTEPGFHLSRLKNWHIIPHPPLQHTSVTTVVTSVFTVSPALSKRTSCNDGHNLSCSGQCKSHSVHVSRVPEICLGWPRRRNSSFI